MDMTVVIVDGIRWLLAVILLTVAVLIMLGNAVQGLQALATWRRIALVPGVASALAMLGLLVCPATAAMLPQLWLMVVLLDLGNSLGLLLPLLPGLRPGRLAGVRPAPATK